MDFFRGKRIFLPKVTRPEDSSKDGEVGLPVAATGDNKDRAEGRENPIWRALWLLSTTWFE